MLLTFYEKRFTIQIVSTYNTAVSGIMRQVRAEYFCDW